MTRSVKRVEESVMGIYYIYYIYKLISFKSDFGVDMKIPGTTLNNIKSYIVLDTFPIKAHHACIRLSLPS